jgi:4-hydroxy-tetrahydrodipicolinate reductase
MKIALLGYGRMGQEIEKIAVSRGHEIVLKADFNGFSDDDISKADVAIDFSVPESAFSNIKQTIKNNVPVVSGTTGWLDKYNQIVDYCNQQNGGFIYASNFSLGVNIFFELNKKLASMISGHNQYAVEMEEIHHTKKLDAPSGTAITLAEGIIDNTNFTNWKLDKADENEIPIIAKRIENVPGTHTVNYTSEIDDIEIKHTAHNRKGFALGAVVAAEWLVDKKGVFSMKDVLGL